MSVPELRIRAINAAPPRPERDYVLYWMIASRRTQWNFSLQRAVELATLHRKPLLILEALRCDYPWASARLHRFVIDGMADNAAALAGRAALYYPYVEPRKGAGKGLLAKLAARACAVVTDDFPTFFLPQMVAAAGKSLDVTLEAVDGNGLLPMRATDRVFVSAYQLRRFLQAELLPHLEEPPLQDPLAGDRLAPAAGDATAARLRSLVGAAVLERWPAAFDEPGEARRLSLQSLPIDHRVGPVPHPGGSLAARQRLRDFLADDLAAYGEGRNHPDHDCASRLSDYLHFGHISVHEVLHELGEAERWSLDDVTGLKSGKRSGWWGMSASAESFLDELVTWRELGYNMCWQRPEHDRYESLPDWAQATLAQHAGDARPQLYELEQFEAASTHDELWNAAQNQLRAEGRIHNYLRMLWGKKILHWSATPMQAIETMIWLNNKYATDGRNPNSYSGIFWCLGRYDRPWGPERPIFGTVRYMTSDNTRRKLSLDRYLQRWAPQSSLPLS